MDEPARTSASGRFLPGGYNYRLFIPFLFHVLFAQAIIGVSRVATTYRVLELDLPIELLGIITGSFALLPMFLAVWLGRWLDRGNDAATLWAGSFLMLGSTLGFWMGAGSATLLILYTGLLGVGHLCIMAGHQTLAIRCAEPRHRDSVFGTYMVAIALGQGLGPLFLGVIAKGRTIAPSEPLFALCVVAGVGALAISFLMRPAPAVEGRPKNSARVPLKDLLRIRGFLAMMLASVMTVTALDLLVVYLPLLGAQREIGAGVIGVLLTIRSGTSVLSRLFFARLVRIVGRTQLMVLCLFMAGTAFLILASPVPLWGLAVGTVMIGFGLGIAAALALSNIVELAPREAQGSAVTLRITGNRIGQVGLPVVGGMLAAAMGAAGVMGAIGLAVGLSGVAVYLTQRRR